MDEAKIADALARAPFGAERPILSKDEACIRAKWIVEDMSKVGLPINIQAVPVSDTIAVPYYEIPQSEFGKEQGGVGVHDTNTAHGSGLNWGDLVRLSKACKIGRTLIPELWPHEFKAKLLGEHNSCIQEGS